MEPSDYTDSGENANETGPQCFKLTLAATFFHEQHPRVFWNERLQTRQPDCNLNDYLLFLLSTAQLQSNIKQEGQPSSPSANRSYRRAR
ncbi:MAG: hypothetical protein LBR98_07425 [Syntrophomonadaceae bacterium]|nr:hypothetical protein [Syntrophomonadaceae bacterium]